MAFVVGKSRNPIVQQAFAGLQRDERAAKKSAKAKPPAADPVPAKKATKRKAAKK